MNRFQSSRPTRCSLVFLFTTLGFNGGSAEPAAKPPIAERPSSPYRVHSLPSPVHLPNGEEFKTWEQPLSFSKTYHVRRNHPHADDDNPGTEDRPFKTIQRAAVALRPGEQVLIGEGIYRELVRPARGGGGPSAMISYKARPGARVVVSGAEELPAGNWEPVSAYRVLPGLEVESEKIHAYRIPESVAPAGAEPFQTTNLSPYMTERFLRRNWMDYAQNRTSLLRFSAMLFQDGRRLEQAVALTALGGFQSGPILAETGPGHFWAAPDGRTIYVWPFGDGDPAHSKWEVTVRRQCFAPAVRGLGFIHVRGLRFEKAGNPFPMPHFGAVSTSAGNHWIIEDNEIRQANSVGLQLGYTHWISGAVPHVGNHIVRGNLIEDCGIGGISGTGYPFQAFQHRIENNVIRNVAYHPVESLHESAAIKLHFAYNCLIRGNRILDTRHGAGVWLDNNVANNRITGNLFYRTDTKFGAVFLEFTEFPNLVDANVFLNGSGAGIYEHDTGHGVFLHNLIIRQSGPPIRLKGGSARSSGLETGKNLVLNNLFIQCGEALQDSSKGTVSAVNLTLSPPWGFGPETQP